MNNKILRLEDVCKKLALSRSTIYRFVENKIFPKPIVLGPRSVGWLESDIEKWICDKHQQIAIKKIARGHK